MTFFARFVREPLIQFFVIGAVVFGLYALTGNRQEEKRDRIVVTEGRVQQLAQVFTKTWQRPPTPQELRGLIDAHVKEEVYYREAVKLGLDRDDTLIRRRMQQKMEFLTEPGEDLLKADDGQLQAFLEANKAEFRVEPRIAFQQVFINPEAEDEPAAVRARKALEALRTSGLGDAPSGLGDPTLLPATIPLSSLSSIGRDFDDAFAQRVADLPKNEWEGPVESPFGLHLVCVTERVEGYDPPLEEVRAAVEQEWRTQKRDNFQNEEYGRLHAKYDVVVPLVDAAGPQKTGAAQ
jgi:hypothetical protein